MNRNFHYLISGEEAGSTIREYLRQRGYSHHILTGLKRSPRGIRLNGERVPVSRILSAGDFLDICLEETDPSANVVPVPMELSILYEDEDLLVLNKPADTPVHPSVNNRENTLANGLAWYYKQQNLPFVCRFISRLDRDTSGLLLTAKNALSASLLSAALKQGQIEKTYLAIVQGQTDETGTISAPIAREAGSALKRRVDFEEGDPAVTHYQLLAYRPDPDISLLSLRLETGRTHQIRVHMLYLGHPLIGDFLYNPGRELIGRQALHAWKLKFYHPITGKLLEFQADPPKDMAGLFSAFNHTQELPHPRPLTPS